MPATRPRRIVRRAVMALVVALLPVWYLASVATILFVDAAGWMPQSCVRPAHAYIYPGVAYLNRNLPGATYCAPVMNWAMNRGLALRIRRQRASTKDSDSTANRYSALGNIPAPSHDMMRVAEQFSRKRRIVRCAVMVFAGIALILAWCVATWLVMSRAIRHKFISDAQYLRPVFYPIIRYTGSELPGAEEVNDLWWRINREDVGPHGWTRHVLSPEGSPPSDMLVPVVQYGTP